jgi:hypothetical protein
MFPNALTLDRSLLLLEGLWDQLELVIASMRACDEQPAAKRVAQSRIATYRVRLREVISKMQRYGAYDREAVARRRLTVALCEVVELLDDIEHEPASNWVRILYQAQDAVLESMHDLRVMRRVPERAPTTASTPVVSA